MINYNEVFGQSNAVEKLFCEPFEKLERFADERFAEKCTSLLNAQEGTRLTNANLYVLPNLYDMISSRLMTDFSFTINDGRLIIFIAFVAGNADGIAMYLTYLQYWCKKNDKKELTLEDFVVDVFENCRFPKQEDLSDLWNAVKVKNNNITTSLLDIRHAARSIQIV